MALEITEIFNRARAANLSDACRSGNLIALPAAGTAVISGDIHGHKRNFERIVGFADLQNNPERHLILQEIIHGGDVDAHGDCLSFQLLAEAAKLKLQFPDRVHIIMGNHDTAYINRLEVLKHGRKMNGSMRKAMQRCFGQDLEQVAVAIEDFLFSQPIAVRTANRIWISHSLPADRFADDFDVDVLKRPLTPNDIIKPNCAYTFTWGRNHSQKILDKFADLFDVDLFVLGHQMQTDGFKIAGRNAVILISEHSHGKTAKINLSETYDLNKLVDSVIPIASLD